MPIPGDFFDAEPEPAQTTPAAAPKQTSAPAPSAIPGDFFDAAPVAPPAAKPTTPQPAGIPSDFFDAPAATQAPPAAGEDFSQLSRLGTTPSVGPLATSVLQPAISDTSAQPAQAASAQPKSPTAPPDAAGIDKMKAAATAAFQPIQQQQNDLQKQATALSQMEAKAQAALAPVQQAQNDLAKQATALDQERGKLDLKSQAAVDAYNAHVQTYEAARVAANSAADSYNKQFHQPLQAANDAYNGTLATARTAFANYQQTFEQPLNAAVDAYNKAQPQGSQPAPMGPPALSPKPSTPDPSGFQWLRIGRGMAAGAMQAARLT